ncbi:MAG: 4'-phosphopantetheinyl transferase superfamily protein [Oscillospiraceae bacterium]|nr:4'-phosphopantetheinyl transferase superfamily protein [Oscillospiraceae bacterium]
MTTVYIIDIPDNIDFKKYICFIKKKINIKINYNKKQSLVAWSFIIKYLESQNLDSKYLFKKNKHGKPFLINNQLYFNISHSHEKVVVAVSSSEVGVDIEKISNRNLKIIDRYFTKKEKDFIFLDNNNIKIINRFYIVWTLKESYLKFKGVGLTLKLNSFEFDFNNLEKIKLILENNKGEDKSLYFRYIDLDNYILSCCGKDKDLQIKKIKNFGF